MGLFRIFILLAAVWVIAAVVIYLVTGRDKWLRIALRSLSVVLAAALIFFGALIVERLF